MPSRARPNEALAPQAGFFFKLEKNDNGLFQLAIAAKNLTLRSSANRTVYRLCDIAQNIPQTIDCDGIERPVKVILKLYCRIPEAKLKLHQEKVRYDKLAQGKLVFSRE